MHRVIRFFVRAVDQSQERFKERKQLHHYRALWRGCGILSLVGGAILMAVLIVGNEQSAAQREAAYAAPWTNSIATVLSRGPYQGDSATESYRLVVLSYRGLHGESHQVESLQAWSTKIGDVRGISLKSDGTYWIRTDLSHFSSEDPTTLNIGTGGWNFCFIVLSVIAGVAVWLALYWLLIQVAYGLNRLRGRLPAPA